jgi:guanine nucleotide-binding protein G(t) subunit alpha 3
VNAVGAVDHEAEAAARHNEEVMRCLDESEETDKGVMKLLLLGAGESGKSTLFKQMKVINKDGYSEIERRAFQSVVWSNTIGSIKTLLDADAARGGGGAGDHSHRDEQPGGADTRAGQSDSDCVEARGSAGGV